MEVLIYQMHIWEKQNVLVQNYSVAIARNG